MFDIILQAGKIFGTKPKSCKEILYQFSSEYHIRADALPNAHTLLSFIERIPKPDQVSLGFEETSTLSYLLVDSAECMDNYECFVKELYDDDEIIVNVVVKKHVDHGVLNVYKTDEFVRFLTSRSPVQSLDNFTNLFKGAEKIVFRTLDQMGTIQTENIAFSDGEVKWLPHIPRKEQLNRCMANHPFLQAIKFSLMPKDFSIRRAACCDFLTNLKIDRFFAELHDLVSDIYTAKYIYMDTTKIILRKNSSNTIIVLEKNLSDNIAEH